MFLQAVKRTINFVRRGDKEHIHTQNVILLPVQLAITEIRRKSCRGGEEGKKETGLRQAEVHFMFPRLCLSLMQRSSPVVRK